MNETQLIGAIETGGTKTVCAIVSPKGEILARTQFATADPEGTFAHAVAYLNSESPALGELGGIGLANFGPISIREEADDYGEVLATPKPGWEGAHVLHEISRHTSVPVALDTDVNCALRAEAKWGAGKGHSDVVYVTIGTGIGAGIMSGGRVLNGKCHPEVGHILVPAISDGEFAGTCRFHGARCLEGIAAGPAIAARWNTDGASLDIGHPAWDLEASYLAVLCTNLIMIFAPQKIVLGGGVMQQRHLFPMIRERLPEYLGDYVDLSRLYDTENSELIVPPALGNDSGVLGASIIGNRFCA